MRPLTRLLQPQRKAFTASSVGASGSFSQGDRFIRAARDSFGWTSTPTSEKEQIAVDFETMVDKAFKENGIVFACVLARLLPFTEARFQYQRIRNGRPGDLFGGTGLSLLEAPWPNGTTGELLARMEQDVSMAGNSFWTRVGQPGSVRLRHLRPDWVTIVSGVRGDAQGSPFALDADVLGYIYKPPRENGVLLAPDQVAHYSPIPDPVAQWRGMSWLSTVLSEVESDSAATRHKARFFRNGALMQFAISYDKDLTADQIEAHAAVFARQHEGELNAYKTLHIGGGADPKTLGLDLKALDFKNVQGAGETRIAAAAGVGAIIARLSEGMQGSSLNQGNYAAAKRQFVDMTLRPLWRTAAASLAKFAEVPSGARLWTDTRDVAFLKEDEKDAALILETESRTIEQLVRSGFDPDAAVKAVIAQDLSLLSGNHTGLFSVQLQAPGTGQPSPTPGGGA